MATKLRLKKEEKNLGLSAYFKENSKRTKQDKTESNVPVAQSKHYVNPIPAGSMKKVHVGLNKPPENRKEQDALALEFLAWATATTSFEMEEFPLSKRINPYRFYKMADSNYFFAEVLEFVKYQMGYNLKKSSRGPDAVVSEQYVLKYFPFYNKEYREMMVSMVSKAIAARSQIIVVKQDEIESSPMVPERNVCE